MITRESIVEAARTYLGTPFRHQGRVKGRGVDCAGLVICVARDLGIRDQTFDISNYGHLPSGGQLEAALNDHLIAINCSEAGPGDVLLMRFEKEPQHVAIVTGPDYLIHSYAQVRKVVEHRIDSIWRGRITAAYRFQEITE